MASISMAVGWQVGCPFVKRRVSTVLLGAIPVIALAGLVSWNHIPGTDISLAVPYAAQGPGPVIDTLGEVDGKQVIDISGAPTDDNSAGELNMTTVAVRTNMSLLQALTLWATTDDQFVPIDELFPPGASEEDISRSNQIAFNTSEANATVAALRHLHKPMQVEVAGVLEGSAAEGVLKEGDVLRAVDGTEVDTPADVRDLVTARAPGETMRFTVLRDGTEHEIPVTLKASEKDPKQGQVGVLMASRSADGIDVTYNLSDVGGPSAGMMFSLAIIDKLTPGDLTSGTVVAGTGTISEDGTVGPIGGIAHKVRAAADEGAQLFLAPEENCREALSADAGIALAKVATLDDALSAMDAHAAGKPYPTCGE